MNQLYCPKLWKADKENENILFAKGSWSSYWLLGKLLTLPIQKWQPNNTSLFNVCIWFLGAWIFFFNFVIVIVVVCFSLLASDRWNLLWQLFLRLDAFPITKHHLFPRPKNHAKIDMEPGKLASSCEVVQPKQMDIKWWYWGQYGWYIELEGQLFKFTHWFWLSCFIIFVFAFVKIFLLYFSIWFDFSQPLNF